MAILLTGFFVGCGLTDPTFEQYDQSTTSDAVVADKPINSCEGLSGVACFTSLIEPKIQDNCVTCHTAGVIGGVIYQASNMESFREALLEFTGNSEKKLDDKLRKGPHGGGVQAEPSFSNINQWLASEGVVDREQPDPVKPDDPEDDDSEDDDSEDDDSEDDDSCGADGMECFEELIEDDFEDRCIGCHANVNIGGVNIMNNNVGTYRQALLDYIGTNVNRLDNKLRVGPHAGGVINVPSQDNILEWLKKEGIE